MIPGVVTLLVLWGATLALSDASSLVVTVFWAVAGSALLLWIRRDMRRDLAAFHEVLAQCRSALSRNEAEVFDIRSSRFVEFEEVEDEGACYAFEIEGGRIVFIAGQQFYPGARFPSHDFSLVCPLDERGYRLDMLIAKRGPAEDATHIIPAEAKLKLEIPEHLEVIDGRLDEIEDLLRPMSGSS